MLFRSPFRQIAEWEEQHTLAFHYFVLGINPSVNTSSLFDYANQKNVQWLSDIELGTRSLQSINLQLTQFCTAVDHIYITICLDVFPGQIAPGVSAPASLGINPLTVIQLIQALKQFKSKTLMLDIAEMNPLFDIDNRTARLAARLIQEFVAD